jgi:hypothetical protein
LGIICKLAATNPPEIIERPNRQATALPENRVGRVVPSAPLTTVAPSDASFSWSRRDPAAEYGQTTAGSPWLQWKIEPGRARYP